MHLLQRWVKKMKLQAALKGAEAQRKTQAPFF